MEKEEKIRVPESKSKVVVDKVKEESIEKIEAVFVPSMRFNVAESTLERLKAKDLKIKELKK